MESEEQPNDNSKSLLEEAQQSGLGTSNIDIPEGVEGPALNLSPRSRSGKELKIPRHVLVCVGCEVYYKNKESWEHCPQCSEELTEVEKA